MIKESHSKSGVRNNSKHLVIVPARVHETTVDTKKEQHNYNYLPTSWWN